MLWIVERLASSFSRAASAASSMSEPLLPGPERRRSSSIERWIDVGIGHGCKSPWNRRYSPLCKDLGRSHDDDRFQTETDAQAIDHPPQIVSYGWAKPEIPGSTA